MILGIGLVGFIDLEIEHGIYIEYQKDIYGIYGRIQVHMLMVNGDQKEKLLYGYLV